MSRDLFFAAIGAAGVGKQTLAYKALMCETDPNALRDCPWQTEVVDGKPINFDAFCYRGQYVEPRNGEIKADAFMLCFSIADRSSFEQLDSVLQQVLQAKGVSKFPVVLVGTKGDLASERQVSEEEARQYAEKLDVEYILTSSTNMTGLHEVVVALVRAVDKSSSWLSKLFK